jgi:hypothetical protein
MNRLRETVFNVTLTYDFQYQSVVFLGYVRLFDITLTYDFQHQSVVFIGYVRLCLTLLDQCNVKYSLT